MMKCLLLLLASGLVTSDKLDRTYLPPPGAKYSGGTLDDLHPPLDFPKETYTGAIQNGPFTYPDKTFSGISTNQENGVFPVPMNYLTLMFPQNVGQSTLFPTSEYQSTIPTATPVSNLYGSYPSKFPSSEYLPSKKSLGTQVYPALNISPGFESSSTMNFRPDPKDTGYNYYVPVKQTYRNGITNQRPSKDGVPVGFIEFPNQVNNGFLLGNGQTFSPGTTNDIVQNYQPSAFGYYGGNPMIMTSQNTFSQESGNMELSPKYVANENNVPVSMNQEKFKDFSKKTSVRPFQTPLVRPNPKNTIKSSNIKTSNTTPSTMQSEFPSTTTRSFTDINVPTVFDRKNVISLRPRYRQERPQAVYDRNAVINNYVNSIYPESYSYSYDTSNGIHADESGTAINGVKAIGSYSYTGDDGKLYTVTYTADENGFRPKGDHLPTPSPVSEEIQKIIDQAARNKAAGIIDDGSYDERKYGHMNYQGAMDRYNTFKMNKNTVSRLGGAKKKQNKELQNKNKNILSKVPVYNDIAQQTIGQATEIPKNLENLNNNDVNTTYIQDGELNGNNILNSGVRSNLKDNNRNKVQLNNKTRRPITSVTNNQIKNVESTTLQTQNPEIKYKPTNTNTGIPDGNTQNIIPSTSSGVTFTDDGYYYVPPIIKFTSNTEKPDFEKNIYLSTNTPTSVGTVAEANKRTSFNASPGKKNIDEKDNSTQLPVSINTAATEPTRQPYISGPNEQDKTYFSTQSQVPIETYRDKGAKYPNHLDSSLYGLSTTPMATPMIQESQPPDEFFNQYYQSTTSPTTFDQAMPTAVENKVNIPGSQGITVSQDFVTTTYRPSISGDGILEVNQNVKIYGLGKPEISTDNNGYYYHVPTYNDGLYTTTSPNQSRTGSAPGIDNSFYTGPAQDLDLFQGIPNENTPYGNQYVTTNIPGADSNIITGLYPNSVLDGQSPTGAVGLPDLFRNPEVIPEQKVAAPNNIPTQNQNQSPGGIYIGENFSGPKQPQKFDPKTGYYYK